MMIEAKHLTKRYGHTVAVDEASFVVRPGRVTGFLGPNGAGKSTTMRMILGLDSPSSGSVLVNGQPYRELTDPLRSVGALLDAKAIVGGRSAAHHLMWLADSNGISRRRVSEVLGIAGLSDVAGQRVGTFSLGMNQRLGIAAALLGDPETVLFDEPINGLDPDGIVWIRNLMKSLAAELTRRGAVLDRGPGGALVVTGLDAAAIGAVASGHSITLLELTTHSATLEEAFFDLTRDETDYHAAQLAGSTRGI
jgi:ABC-2 type transport system ATP-binding protein